MFGKTKHTTGNELPKTIQGMLATVKAVCRENKIKITFVQKPTALWRLDPSHEGSECGGWYDSDAGDLTVAVGKPLKAWLPVLVHEFAHVNQKILDTWEWTNCFDPKTGKDYNETIDHWLEKDVELDEGKLWLAIESILLCEHQAEVLSLGIVQKFGLEKWIKRPKYIATANAYAIQWCVTGLTRSWPKARPYENKKILKQMETVHLIGFNKAREKADELKDLYLKEIF